MNTIILPIVAFFQALAAYASQQVDPFEVGSPSYHIVGDRISVQHINDEVSAIGTVEQVSFSPEHIAVGCQYAVLFRKQTPYAQAYWVSVGGVTKVERV